MTGVFRLVSTVAICAIFSLFRPSAVPAANCENLVNLPASEKLSCLDREVQDTKDTIQKLTNKIIETFSKKPPQEGIYDKRWMKLLRAETNTTIGLAEVKCQKEFLEGGATSSGAIQRRSCELEILSDHELFLKTAYFKQ